MCGSWLTLMIQCMINIIVPYNLWERDKTGKYYVPTYMNKVWNYCTNISLCNFIILGRMVIVNDRYYSKVKGLSLRSMCRLNVIRKLKHQRYR